MCIQYIFKFSNCLLWILKQQEVTELPCCPLKNPNECRVNQCYNTSAPLPSTLCNQYMCPAGGNFVSNATNFPQGACFTWTTASPVHFSFTWHYSVVEAISCSCELPDVFGSVVIWLHDSRIQFLDNRASWHQSSQIIWGHIVGVCCVSTRRQTEESTEYVLFFTLCDENIKLVGITPL